MFLGLKQSDVSSYGTGCEILTTSQMISADKQTIESGADGYDLMTAAGQSVANIVHEYYPEHAVLVLCGPGNNGGDGYIAARFLEDIGHDVYVMSLSSGWKLKGDAKKAYKDWEGAVYSFKDNPDVPENTVIIDAVFGTGLSKPLKSPVIEVFEEVRKSELPVVAVDIPSGVNGDTGLTDPNALQATHTVTFFRKKRGHVFMPGLSLCGDVSVHDIGIAPECLAQAGELLHDNAPALWLEQLPKPGRGAHKYSRGHLVVLGGARMTGAARMSSEAAMRSGTGLCTIVSEQSAAEIYKRGAAHVMHESLNSYNEFAAHIKDRRRNAILMGPGAGLDDRKALQSAVLEVLKTGKATVLDADALSCFEDDADMLIKALHDKCVITPHEGEFNKLFPDLDSHKLERAQKAAQLSGAIILLKGPDTVIAAKNKITVINTHATPWLATAGSGDVLAGLIAGLMAQDMEPHSAACAACWIHGEAAQRHGPGLVAPDIIENIPSVLRDFS